MSGKGEVGGCYLEHIALFALGYRRPLVGTGWPISAVFDINGVRIQPSHLICFSQHKTNCAKQHGS